MTALRQPLPHVPLDERGLRELQAWLGREPKPTVWRSLCIVIDEMGDPITTGIKLDFRFNYDCQITEWTLLADQSGSMVVDVWKTPYTQFPPTVDDAITGTDIPTLSGTSKARSGNLTGWKPLVYQGDILRFNVTSTDGVILRVTLELTIKS